MFLSVFFLNLYNGTILDKLGSCAARLCKSMDRLKGTYTGKPWFLPPDKAFQFGFSCAPLGKPGPQKPESRKTSLQEDTCVKWCTGSNFSPKIMIWSHDIQWLVNISIGLYWLVDPKLFIESQAWFWGVRFASISWYLTLGKQQIFADSVSILMITSRLSFIYG